MTVSSAYRTGAPDVHEINGDCKHYSAFDLRFAGACPVADKLGQCRRVKLHHVANNRIARSGAASSQLPIHATWTLSIRALHRRIGTVGIAVGVVAGGMLAWAVYM